MKHFSLTAISIVALLVCGCQSAASKKAKKQAESTAYSVSEAPSPQTSQSPMRQFVSASAPSQQFNTQRTPFIIAPKYRRVHLKGYIDEHGRAVSPQEVVQEEASGGINPDALDNWDNSYIPVENVQVPVGMGSPVMAAVPQTKTPDDSLLENNEVDGVIITGYYRDEDEPMVDELAKHHNRIKHRDSNLGWVLLKK